MVQISILGLQVIRPVTTLPFSAKAALDYIYIKTTHK